MSSYLSLLDRKVMNTELILSNCYSDIDVFDECIEWQVNY